MARCAFSLRSFWDCSVLHLIASFWSLQMIDGSRSEELVLQLRRRCWLESWLFCYSTRSPRLCQPPIDHVMKRSSWLCFDAVLMFCLLFQLQNCLCRKEVGRLIGTARYPELNSLQNPLTSAGSLCKNSASILNVHDSVDNNTSFHS